MRIAREYRYPLDRWIFELPGGGVEPGEEPVEAAHREYEEELGLRPIDLTLLHTFSQNPGRHAYPIYLYLCTRTVPGTKITDDPQEVVRAVDMSVDDFEQLVSQGEIVDPCLLIARLVAAQKGLLPTVG